jgi:uncharacterized protein (TIGR03084 family)
VDVELAALAEQHAELDDLIAGLDPAQWARPSPCEGWSVADVVLHLSQTDGMAIASLEGRFAEDLAVRTMDTTNGTTVDDGADAMVRGARGAPGSVVRDRWRANAATLRERFAAVDPHTRVDWVAGTLSARTLASTRLSECWIHTGDVAGALGVEHPPTPRLRSIARLAWRTLPYAFERAGRTLHGPVAFELRGPDGAAWSFRPDQPPATVVRGEGAELCLVAARRVGPSATSLEAEGPDADAVLELVRTYT